MSTAFADSRELSEDVKIVVHSPRGSEVPVAHTPHQPHLFAPVPATISSASSSTMDEHTEEEPASVQEQHGCIRCIHYCRETVLCCKDSIRSMSTQQLRELRMSYVLFMLGLMFLIFAADMSFGVFVFAFLCAFAMSLCLRVFWIARLRRQTYDHIPQQELVRLQAASLFNLNPTHLRLAMMDRDFNANDYETLLRLDDEHRATVFTGIPQSQIERLPTHRVTESDIAKAMVCSVCLDMPKPNDVLRTLPCLHKFHADCVDKWLRTKPTCPVCTFPVFG